MYNIKRYNNFTVYVARDNILFLNKIHKRLVLIIMRVKNRIVYTKQFKYHLVTQQ